MRYVSGVALLRVPELRPISPLRAGAVALALGLLLALGSPAAAQVFAIFTASMAGSRG